MSNALIFTVGFIAQALFSARLVVQWVMSERAHKVVSPSAFWILSLLAAVLLFCYGWLRDDFSIMLGQLLGYYIYIWNLKMKQQWQKLPLLLRWAVLLLPALGLFQVIANNHVDIVNTLFRNQNIPLWLVLFGSAGQTIFTLRFIYQWLYSRKMSESVLPIGFWVISLVGSSLIVAYGVIRLDPVLILGQSLGFIVYIRNIVLFTKSKRSSV